MGELGNSRRMMDELGLLHDKFHIKEKKYVLSAECVVCLNKEAHSDLIIVGQSMDNVGAQANRSMQVT